MSLNRLSADTVIGIAFAAIALYLLVQGVRAFVRVTA